MKQLTSVLSVIFILVCIASIPNNAFAGVVQVPVDGGLSLLLVAGVGYGVKKLRDEQRKQQKKSKQGSAL